MMLQIGRKRGWDGVKEFMCYPDRPAYQIPSAPFSGMLVHLCHAQTPDVTPDHVCHQFETAKLVLQFK